MPDLAHSLPSKDLGFLRIVATLWGLELTSNEAVSAVAELSEALCDAELAGEVVATLPQNGRAALDALLEQDGRLPWVIFTRRFGEVREMGAGRRDREQPHLRPNSAAEVLWYRALVARAFFDTEKGPQEFAYIPDDLLMALDFAGIVAEKSAQEELPEPSYGEEGELESAGEEEMPGEPLEPEIRAEAPGPKIIRPAGKNTPPVAESTSTPARPTAKSVFPVAGPIKNAPRPKNLPPAPETAGDTLHPAAKSAPRAAETTAEPSNDALGRPASPAEKACPLPASDRLLDDACTLLAALRMGLPLPNLRIPAPIIREFLLVGRLMSAAGPLPEPVKTFLEAPREKALAALVAAWQDSIDFNELRQLPGLSCEGEWKNEPLETREFLLNLLEPIPEGTWWSLPAFVRDIKAKYPDFQRPAGDYDSWFIQREADGVFLRGFAHWDEVDGALIRYFFQVLHWLGQVDLASAEENGPVTAFRLRAANVESPVSTSKVEEPALSSPKGQKSSLDETGKLTVNSTGRIAIPRLVPRAARYQVARFCEWDEEKDDEYRYHVTPGSLKRAREQGLKPDHLLTVLRKHASAPLPPPFVKALQRWEVNGPEARVETLAVLRVSKPEVLNELRNSKAARFLGEILGPTTIIVKSGAEAKIIATLAEMGLLAEIVAPGEAPKPEDNQGG